MYNAANYYEIFGVSVMLLLNINFVTVCGYRSCLFFQKMQFYKSYLGKNVTQITTKRVLS